MDAKIINDKKYISIIKNVIKVIAFVFIGLILFTWISYLYRPDSNVRRNVIGFYAEPKDSLDIVWIGTSTTIMYWIPMKAWNEYGITSYNFATNNMPPQLVKYYLIEMLKTQHPDLVMIDVRPFQYGAESSDEVIKQGLHYASDSFNYSLNRLEMIKNTLPESSDPLPFYFDIALYHNNDTGITPEQLVMSTNSFSNFAKGFMFEKAYAPVDKVEVKDITDKIPLNEEMEGLLTDVMDLCEAEDIPVIFFVPPYSMMQRAERPDYDATDEQRMYNYMEELIKSRGFDFINLNNYYDEIGLDFNHDFYNWAHVNAFGAEKFTDFMLNYILEKYQFEDKREDPEYTGWNEEYPLFQQEFDDTKAAVQWIYENPDYDYGIPEADE